MSDLPGGPGAATKETAMTLMDAMTQYIIPFVGIIVGWFAGSAIGGINAVYNAIIGATTNAQVTSNAGRLAGVAVGAVYFALAILFWRMGSSGGKWTKAIGRGLGGFFGGAGVWAISQVWNPRQTPGGFLDTVASKASQAAGGPAVPGS